MKATVKAGDIRRAIKSVKPAVRSESPLDRYRLVYLSLGDGVFSATATNGDSTIVSTCEAEVEQGGAAYVDPDNIFRAVETAADDEGVSLTVGKSGKLDVRAGKARVSLNLTTHEPPTYPEVSFEDAFAIPVEDVKSAIDAVGWIAGRFKHGNILGAIAILPGTDDESVRLSATSGPLLGVRRSRRRVLGEGMSAAGQPYPLIPIELVTSLRPVLSDGGEVEFATVGNTCAARVGGTTLLSQHHAGRYVRFDSFLSRVDALPRTASASAEDIVEAMRVAELATDPDGLTSSVVIRGEGEAISVSGQSNATGTADVEFAAEVGEPFEARIIPNQVLQALRGVKGDVSLRVTGGHFVVESPKDGYVYASAKIEF